MAALQDAMHSEGLTGDGKFLVLKRTDGQFFREWLYRVGRCDVSDFRWTKIRSLARAFPLRDRVLAERFQVFIRDFGLEETEFFLVEGDCFVKWNSPSPRQIPAKRPVLDIRENKKRGDWFQGR
jgi:hypothetical protein